MKVVTHALADHDVAPVAKQRAVTLPHRGLIDGPQGRPGYVAMLEQIRAPTGVRFEAGEVAGTQGWWLVPEYERPEARLLFSHGGGYVLGSAQAYRNFAGHFSHHTRLRTFVPDYPLAPEHRYPAPTDALWEVYQELARDAPVVLVGDSAGGNASLVLAARAARKGAAIRQPLAVAVMSAWTDVANTGDSYRTRADADFIFTHAQLDSFARHYLGSEGDATNPDVSPWYEIPKGLPPTNIQVGDDEILLDDSRRYAERSFEQGNDVSLSIWSGMAHVFQMSVGKLHAADRSIEEICTFITGRLEEQVR